MSSIKRFKGRITGMIRSNVYNGSVGYFYTQGIMRKVLESLPDNVMILDVGIGTGYTYAKNDDLIKRKNLAILGVDIDPEYIRHAEQAVIDHELEDQIKLIVHDIYVPSSEIPTEFFDYVIFSDSYAVIPEVHEMISFCERFLRPNSESQMIVVSTLFDQYNDKFDWIKNHIIYLTSIDFGKMMVKNDLMVYIQSRIGDQQVNDQSEIEKLFVVIDQRKYPGITDTFKTYMVKWTPASVIRILDE